MATDHPSRLENLHLEKLKEEEINDVFPEERLHNLEKVLNSIIPWFADIANYLAANILPKGLSHQ